MAFSENHEVKPNVRCSKAYGKTKCHSPQQPLHTLAIDFLALTDQPGRHTTAAVERMPGVLLVEQTHQPQVRGCFLSSLIVQARPSQTEQLALPPHAQLGMILVDQATLVSYRDRQLFF